MIWLSFLGALASFADAPTAAPDADSRAILASTCDLRIVPGVGVASGVLTVTGMNDENMPIPHAAARAIVSRIDQVPVGASRIWPGPPKTLSYALFGVDPYDDTI